MGKNTVFKLEEKYASRGFRFTKAPHGLEPVQAYGRIDGKYFYFRLRGNIASLEVGSYSKEDELKRAIVLNRKKRKYIENLTNSEQSEYIDFDYFFNANITLYETAEEAEFLPTKDTETISLEIDELKSAGTPTSQLNIFTVISNLVDKLDKAK